MSYEDILIARESPVSAIAINRLKRLNATRLQTLQEIMEILKELAFDDTVRVVVFTGTGDRAFSVGADISYAEKLTLGDTMNEQLFG